VPVNLAPVFAAPDAPPGGSWRRTGDRGRLGPVKSPLSQEDYEGMLDAGGGQSVSPSWSASPDGELLASASDAAWPAAACAEVAIASPTSDGVTLALLGVPAGGPPAPCRRSHYVFPRAKAFFPVGAQSVPHWDGSLANAREIVQN
jgi:hypothetical protein